MDKIVLSFVVEETLAKVDSFITDETVRAWNLGGARRRLLELLSEIRDLLLSAEEKQMGNHMRLKEVAYGAQDILDELAFEILRPKITGFNFLKNLIFSLKLAHKVKIVNQSLDKFKNEIRFPLQFLYESDGRIIPRHRVIDSVLDNYPVVGREDDASKIVNLLTHSSDQQVLTVVPIVGMGGLGKTSLAKLVCRQVMALSLFDFKMWVCVSENSDEQNVLGQMLRSSNATMGVLSLTNKDAMLQQLEKELARKKFLLVLDDVCEDVSRWWDDFRTWLLKNCTNNGNVVLVTTRSEEVASIVETSSQHRHTLGFLSDDECWFILKERALRNVPAHELVLFNLEVIGREIAKQCKGVPLAAKVLSGTLRFYRDEGAWLRIRDSLFLKAMNNEENVEFILKLSFDHFPSYLKACLAICSVFPKGFSIIKEDLIQLWMAERFANSCDMGNEYFHALLANSFFHDAESDDDGNVIKCKMHNLVHDLALSLAKSEMRIHYLYADYQSSRTSESLPKNKAKYLSTIILNGAPFQRSWNSKSLRTLYLNDIDMESLSSSLSKLKHFKYLHVSNTKTSPLPKSIVEIYMLQILTLSNCSCEQLPFLGNLPFLKFLKISHMERVKCIGNESDEGNSSRHELRLFPALKSLSLSWMENLTEWIPPSHGNRVVIFPLLENLSIQCCAKLTGFPMRDLSALVKMEIKECEELRFIFDEQKSFPSVKTLSIVGCPKLTYLRNWLLSNDSYEEFRVRRCEWLRFIPEDLGMQRSLISLQIYCCKGLRFFSEEILCKLTQLRKLSIGAFSEKLDDFRYLNRIKDLRRLEELEIWGSDVFGRKMSVLPNQLQKLARLQSLKIKGFTAMEALPEWLGDLQSLETISLNYCWQLQHQSTAAMIQRLFKLRRVYIYGCHTLEDHKSHWMEFSGALFRRREWTRRMIL
ncbi:putative disease resistance protein RGA3 isoform X2 [Euphorbia lathyris]|uniref:putative disease resistance protein RGA3 isoform X2 n=1 Tax=Euphorbia lathyris TaxID=212925 RepID=UPI0033139D03